jgi:hypothetical protein
MHIPLQNLCYDATLRVDRAPVILGGVHRDREHFHEILWKDGIKL